MATPEQWDNLRARIEALEAAIRNIGWVFDKFDKMVATSEAAPVAAPVASTPYGLTHEQARRNRAAEAGKAAADAGIEAALSVSSDSEQGGRQMPEGVRFIPLVWTENLPPNDECWYDHCKANTPFGIFRITWKSWKQYESPTIDETPWGDFWTAFESIEKAKEKCQEEYEKRLRDCMAVADRTPPAGGLVERVENRAGGDGRAALREVAGR